MKAMFILALPILCCACSGTNHSDDEFIVSLQRTLDQSTDLVNRQSQTQFELLKAKQYDPVTSARAIRWLPTAEKIKESTSSLVNYIDGLQIDFKKRKSDNTHDAGITLIEKDKLEPLKERITGYRNMISNLGEEINKIFKKEIDQVKTLPAQSDTNNDNGLFAQKTNGMVLVALSSFKSNVRVVENAVLNYCNSMASPGCILRYDKFEVLVGQNANILRAGDELIINTGVGSFSNAAKPVFHINGKTIPSEWGQAEYKIHVKGNPGNYSIPVDVSYTKPDGTNDKRVFTVNYTIFDENKD